MYKFDNVIHTKNLIQSNTWIKNETKLNNVNIKIVID